MKFLLSYRPYFTKFHMIYLWQQNSIKYRKNALHWMFLTCPLRNKTLTSHNSTYDGEARTLASISTRADSDICLYCCYLCSASLHHSINVWVKLKKTFGSFTFQDCTHVKNQWRADALGVFWAVTAIARDS